MRIGIIGAGSIGGTLVRKLSAAGHVVRAANRRGPESLAELTRSAGATAVGLDDVIRCVDVLIMSIPFRSVPDLRPLLDRLPGGVPIVDTSNYYPHRDGRIESIDNGLAEGIWIEQRLGRPVVRAWNALLQTTLAAKGRPPSADFRIAVPVAGTDWAAKKVVMGLVDETGFSPVDAGTVEDTWRMQAGAPAYCTELDASQLRRALTLADRDAVSARREALMALIGSWDSGASFFDDLVALNRAAAGLGRLLG